MSRAPNACELCEPREPRRHVASFFDLSGEEQIALLELLNRAQRFVQQEYSPDGYNVGARGGIRCVLKR